MNGSSFIYVLGLTIFVRGSGRVYCVHTFLHVVSPLRYLYRHFINTGSGVSFGSNSTFSMNSTLSRIVTISQHILDILKMNSLFQWELYSIVMFDLMSISSTVRAVHSCEYSQ